MTQLHTAPAPPSAATPRPARSGGSIIRRPRYRRRSSLVRHVRLLSWCCLAGSLLLAGLLLFVSENWWVTAALTFLPRTVWLAAPLLLLGFSLTGNRRMAFVNLASLAVLLLVVAEFQLPLSFGGAPGTAGTHPLRIASCNVQNYQPSLAAVLREVNRQRPDVLLLQEARDDHPLLAELFADWHVYRYEEFWIGSRYPLTFAGRCESQTFHRTTGIAVDIDTPDGTVRVVNVHLMTARHGLTELDSSALVDGAGRNRLERHIALRDEEARITRAFVDATDRRTPVIVAGDFNMPRLSSIFRAHWGDLPDTRSVGAPGFAYTSPVRPHRFWPDGLPWVRVDHILCSPHWHMLSSRTGTSRGSDHFAVYATLSLRRPRSRNATSAEPVGSTTPAAATGTSRSIR